MNTSAREAQRLIDESIEGHLASMLTLRSQRNDFAAISCLPPEILSRIFYFAQKALRVMYPGFNNPFCDIYDASEEVKFSDWITVTQVCRHWRNVALSTPILWIEPPLGNLRWLEEMLRRSRDASLIITADLDSGPKIASGLKEALKKGSRIQDLSIVNIDTDRWANFNKWLPKLAPRLEILRLEGGISEDIEDQGVGSLIDIPEGVFCETEKLHHLELTDCLIDWNLHAHLFRSLTHLKLHELQSSVPTAEELVDVVFKNIPNLQFLDLRDCLPRGEKSWALGRHIHLACLQTLRITATYGEAEPFFRHVTFPPTAIVKVACHDMEWPCTFSAGAVIKGIIRSYIHADATSFRNLILTPPSLHPRGVRLRFFVQELLEVEMLDHANADAALELTFICDENERSNIRLEDTVTNCMQEIFNDGMPLLRNIVNVHFDEKIKGLNVMTIANTVGMLPLVEYVMASFEAARPFCEALQLQVTPLLATLTDRASEPVLKQPFSQLAAIHLRDMSFIQPNTPASSTSPNVPMKLLQDIITQRSECDSVPNIGYLMIGFCHYITEADVAFFKEWVADVDVFS